MGRPLLSTLIAPAAPVVRIAVPDANHQTYERWSYVNSFDPDADEFFEGDDVVYEAFLSPEEIAERENAPTRVDVSTPIVIRNRLLRAAQVNSVANAELAGQDDRPDLLSSSVDYSSSSSSDTTSSGRASPAETDELLDASPYDIAGLDNIPPVPSFVATQSLARSLPSTPTRASWIAESPVVFAHAREIPPPSTDPVDIPASPIPHPALAVASPMTPPGSVTPRFLSWGGASRPRAIDMSPSPTPAAPFGSARASRMSVAYISPPALRVQQ